MNQVNVIRNFFKFKNLINQNEALLLREIPLSDLELRQLELWWDKTKINNWARINKYYFDLKENEVHLSDQNNLNSTLIYSLRPIVINFLILIINRLGNLDEEKLTHIWPSLIDFLGIDGIKETHFADLVHLYIKKIGLICFQKNDDTQYKINSLLIHAPVPKNTLYGVNRFIKIMTRRLQSLI